MKKREKKKKAKSSVGSGARDDEKVERIEGEDKGGTRSGEIRTEYLE